MDEKRMGNMDKPERDVSGLAGAKIKAEHVVEEGETLSGIAEKYYGSGSKDNWMKIYDHNKQVIGDNPNVIKPGQRLRIPEL